MVGGAARLLFCFWRTALRVAGNASPEPQRLNQAASRSGFGLNGLSGRARVGPAICRGALIALAAIEFHAKCRLAPFVRLGPGPVEPWRIVADMLVMTACKFGNPVLGVIQTIGCCMAFTPPNA
jgi:hypothetical protein